MTTISQRAKILATAATALALSHSGQAFAADASVTTAVSPFTSAVIGSVVSGDGAAQFNTAIVEADVTGSTITTTVSGASTGSFINSTNTADAIAFGNRNGVTASLATISSSGTADGIAVATVSSNTGAITATASGLTAGATLNAFASGSVQVVSNSIDAVTTINDGSNGSSVTLNNSIPIGYTNTADSNGSAVLGSTTDTILAGGTLVAGNTQVSAGADSSATASGNNVNLVLTNDATAATVVNGSAMLDSNNVGAAFTANTRTSSISLAADNASFGGTAVIANSQSFDGNTTADNALNSNNNVTATVENGTGAATFSNSSLSVDSNLLTAAASGNVLVGSIALASGLSYNLNAAAGSNTSTIGLDAGAAGAATDVNATGALTIASSQINDAATSKLSATTTLADITATVAEPVNSAITLSTNRVTAAVTGNSLNTAIASGTGSALFDGSATLANLQVNDIAISATASDTTIAVTLGALADGTVSGSSATINANIVAASAVGSQADQTIALSAATVTTSTGYATLAFDQTPAATGDKILSTSGAVSIASRQLNDALGAVSASATGTSITLTSNDLETAATTDGITANSQLSVTNNIQQAFAVGGDAGNNLSLSGVTVGAGAGIANNQVNLAGATVEATLTGSAALVVTDSAGDGVASPPSLTLSGNRSEALATGLTAANALSVEGATVTLAADAPPRVGQTLDTAVDTGGITASYGVMNQQLVSAAVSATAQPETGAAAFAVTVGDNANGAAVINDANRLTAQAQAAVAANSVDLAIGTLSVATAGANNVASVLNLQQVAAAVTATATSLGLTPTATPIDNLAVVLTSLGNDATDVVTNASVSTSANRVTAIADGAVASNSLVVSGTSLAVFDGTGTAGASSVDSAGLLTTDAAFTLMNRQEFNTTASVTATLREATDDSARVLTDVAGIVTGSSIVSNGNLLTALASSLESSNSLVLDGTALQTTGALLNSQDSAAEVNALIGLDAATNVGGVSVAIDGNIGSSNVSVAGNSVTGQALGNTASNSLIVAATSLEADGANTGATSGTFAVANGAEADFVLANDQNVVASTSNANVFGSFGITQAVDQTITGSTLSVDGNAQTAEAMANTASNTLSVAATDMDVTNDTSAALANRQGGTASVAAVSNLDLFANVQSSGSTVSLDGNSNRAVGVVNNAVNSLTVAGTNIAGTGSNAVVTDTTGATSAVGSFALNNSQTVAATSPLDTTATTNIYNVDRTDTASTGIVNGSVSMAGNLTFAESSANRASNSVTVAGGASNSAPAALANDQLSAATVNATATSAVRVELDGTDHLTTDIAAASGSAVSVAGNTTQALARGNTTTNTMVFTAGADFGTATTGANITGTASGAAAMLNRQENTGDVTASANSTGYSVALNGGGIALSPTNPGVLNAAVSVTGNTVAAFAVGNQATNRMELAVLNTGNATAAFNNVQSNGGVIRATANTVSFTSSVTGTVTNGAFRNVGNAASATAVGNSAITSIIGR